MTEVLRISDLWMCTLKWNIYINHTEAQGASWEEAERARGWGGVLRKVVSKHYVATASRNSQQKW